MSGILTPSWQKPPRGAMLDRSHPFNVGVAADWLFNEGTGPLVNDISGNHHTGTVVGTTSTFWQPSTSGLVGIFDSITTVNVPTSPQLSPTGKMSICAWVWLPSNPSGTPTIVSPGYDGTSEGFWLRFNGATEIQFGMFNGSTHSANYTWTALLKQRLFLVGVYDGKAYRLYLNGGQVASATDSTGPTTVAEQFTIGGEWLSGSVSRQATANISRIRLLSRAMLPAEITSVYAAPYQMIAPIIPDAVFYSIGGATSPTRFRRTLLTGGMADYTGRLHG